MGGPNDALEPDPPRPEVVYLQSERTEVAAALGPLSGYRGLVFTQAWAGTYATQLLGFMGTEILQVEVRKRLHSWRGTYDSPRPAGLATVSSARHA